METILKEKTYWFYSEAQTEQFVADADIYMDSFDSLKCKSTRSNNSITDYWHKIIEISVITLISNNK